MLSVPPATTTLLAPVCTCSAASMTACSPDPQRRSTWMPGTAHRQAGIQRNDPPDGRGLAVGAAVAQDDVVDVLGIDAGALKQRL